MTIILVLFYRANERSTALERELFDYKQQIVTVLSDVENKHHLEMEALRQQFKISSEETMAIISKQAQEINSFRVNIIVCTSTHTDYFYEKI